MKLLCKTLLFTGKEFGEIDQNARRERKICLGPKTSSPNKDSVTTRNEPHAKMQTIQKECALADLPLENKIVDQVNEMNNTTPEELERGTISPIFTVQNGMIVEDSQYGKNKQIFI